MNKKFIICVISVVSLAIITREFGCIDFNWYKGKKDSSITLGGLHQVFNFQNVKDVIVINEFGENQIIPIDQEGAKIIKLIYCDRFSSWPIFAVLPLYKTGESSHRIYFRIEYGDDRNGYDKWAITINKDAKVNSSILGFCSNRFYRHGIIRELESFDERDFKFNK